MSPKPPANSGSDVISTASFGGSNDNYEYFELSKNLPSSSSNILELAVHIRKLETMHKVSEGDINDIIQPTVLFSYTGELKIRELADAETNPSENLQDNGATLPVGTQISLPQSPLEEIMFASSEPPQCPRVEAGYAALQARAGDLLDVHLLGADNIPFRVYQDLVYQNPG